MNQRKHNDNKPFPILEMIILGATFLFMLWMIFVKFYKMVF